MNPDPTIKLASDMLVHAVIGVLNKGETLLGEIADEHYVRRLPAAFNASIGGHYRHCFDHFRSLLDSATAGDLNYDHPERRAPIQNDPFSAVNAARALREDYPLQPPGRLDPQH